MRNEIVAAAPVSCQCEHCTALVEFVRTTHSQMHELMWVHQKEPCGGGWPRKVNHSAVECLADFFSRYCMAIRGPEQPRVLQ